MKHLILVALLLLAACANSPERPGLYTTPAGEKWVISFRSSPVSGSTHLYINGDLVGSGSFGLGYGNSASGSGRYGGLTVTFFCTRRATPDCLVYADGVQVADLRYRYASPVMVESMDPKVPPPAATQ